MEFLVRSATVADAPAIAQVHVASWQSAYRDVLPAEFLSTLNVERRTEAWRRVLEGGPGSVLVATTTGHQILGFCHVGPNRGEPTEFLGEVYAIYLLAHARRRGVGRELLTRGTALLRSRAQPSSLVWVLELNVEGRAASTRSSAEGSWPRSRSRSRPAPSRKWRTGGWKLEGQLGRSMEEPG
jgi:ribosomal protein S18 acetylase RimI-like enzyme